MKDQKRQFEGIFISRKIWLTKELSPLEKLFYVEIRSLSATKKGCFASNKHFAELFGVTPKYASRVINNLVEIGWVKQFVDKQKANQRTLLAVDKKEADTIPQKEETPIPQKGDSSPTKSGGTIPQKEETPIPQKGDSSPTKSGGTIPQKEETPIPQKGEHINNTNTNINDNTHLIIKETSLKKALELELKSSKLSENFGLLQEAKKEAIEYELKLHNILPARTKGERTMYGRLRDELQQIFEQGNKNVFIEAIQIASNVTGIDSQHRRATFFKAVKKKFNIGSLAREQILQEVK